MQRILAQAELQPHRLERYMASNDPEFEAKAADMIGLYLNPPQHAAVFCVDEKTAIQALDRLGSGAAAVAGAGRAAWLRILPARHAVAVCGIQHEDRQGQGQDGQAAHQRGVHRLPHRHRGQPGTQGQEIHIVLDNLSAHKTKAVEQFLAEHPKVHIHFTPTYSSWLNQVELWFAKVQRDVISRGVFTSVSDLGRKLMKYIRAYSKIARPFRWTYTDPQRRIHAKQITETAH